MSKALSNVIPTVRNVVLSFRLLACTLFIKCLCSNFVFQTNTKSQRHQTRNTGESQRSIHSIVMGQASICIQFVLYSLQTNFSKVKRTYIHPFTFQLAVSLVSHVGYGYHFIRCAVTTQ